MLKSAVIGATVAAALVGAAAVRSVLQAPAVQPVDEKVLREYAGAYQWDRDAFLYLQMWNEMAGTHQLVALDESGELRTLYPTDRDRFFTGPGAAVPTAIESRIAFQRDRDGRIDALTWQRDGAAPRVARRVAIETREDVRFASGDVQLAGTLIGPSAESAEGRAAGTQGAPPKHPAIVLVHGSGAQDREWLLPWARFLIRHGVAVLGYDKRGVGGSTGEWNTASFDDLAGDVVAAVRYLKTRDDIDPARIGLLGCRQAGWIMPLAAVRTTDIAFLISLSGAAIPAAETTIDHAQNEMTAGGMRPEGIALIVELMKRQYQFARTGEGWDEYAAARAKAAARFGGKPPGSFPGTPDHPSWQFMRRLYFYDPAPTLRQLRTPTLALFGELDNNVMAEKNKAAWEAALKAGGHPDYTLQILPRANHLLLEAKVGHNAEMKSLQRFAHEYAATVKDWLAKRIRTSSP